MEGSVAAANDKRLLEKGIQPGAAVSKEMSLSVWNL
jgi:hypothetical protein